jgi:hypothetical protein
MTMDETLGVRIIIIEAQSEAVIVEVIRELGMSEKTKGFRIAKTENIYNVSGPAGVVGTNAVSMNDTFIQSVADTIGDADFAILARQLDIVRMAMKSTAGASTAEQDEEIGHLAKAQIAAEKGHKTECLSHLKKVGEWTMSVAKEVSAEIVALTITHLLGAGT